MVYQTSVAINMLGGREGEGVREGGREKEREGSEGVSVGRREGEGERGSE